MVVTYISYVKDTGWNYDPIIVKGKRDFRRRKMKKLRIRPNLQNIKCEDNKINNRNSNIIYKIYSVLNKYTNTIKVYSIV